MNGRSSLLIKLFKNQDGKCHYCRRNMTLDVDRHNSITRDHIIPRSRGGGGLENITGACFRCNNLKGDMTGSEFMAAWNDFVMPERLPSACVVRATRHDKAIAATTLLKKRQEKAARRLALQEAIWLTGNKWTNLGRAGYDPKAMGLCSSVATLGDFLDQPN